MPTNWLAQSVVNGVHTMRSAVLLPSLGFVAGVALALGFAAPSAAVDTPIVPVGVVVSPDVDLQKDVRVFSSDSAGARTDPQAAAACGPFSAYGPPGGSWGPIATWIN